MKNLIIVLTTILAFTFTNNLMAQPAGDMASVTTEVKLNVGDDVPAILTNYKATKAEKKLTRKVKKFVTPKIIKKGEQKKGLEDKSVTVQITLDNTGKISNMQIVKGIASQLDERVMQLIRDYDAKHPFADSKVNKPTTMQMEIGLLLKQYYGY